MPDLGSADVLVTLLDRQFGYLLSHQRHRRLLLLPRLIAFVQRDPHLAGLMADMQHELSDELRHLENDDAALRSQLRSLWQSHGETVRRSLEADLRDEDRHRQLNSYCRLEDFDSALHEVPALTFDSLVPRPDTDGGTTSLIRALIHWTTWAIQTTAQSSGHAPLGLESVPAQLEDLAAVRAHHLRRLHLAAQSMPGAAFARLIRIAERLNPAPPPATSDFTQQLLSWAHFKTSEAFAERVHAGAARKNFEIQDDIDVLSDQVAADAALVHDELRSRVLLGRSRRALVEHFAARAEAFDASRLRELADGDTRNAERLLTLDFAKYLFDQGLTPLIDPTIGGLRPDVLNVSKGPLFYAEAKQYAARSPRAALVKAYGQVWSTWGRLRNQFDVPEAFLVVFRRSGPRVELPPVIPFRGLRLYSVLADLDCASGSAEKYRPLSLSESELVPEGAVC